MTKSGSPAPDASRRAVGARRVDLPCGWAGFTPPPCNVQLKFVPAGSAWVLVALTAPGLPTRVARWLEPFGPSAVSIAPGLSPRVLRAHFRQLPARWNWMLSEVDVRFLELTPEGSASLFVQDSPEHLDRLMAGMPSLPGRVRHRPTHSGHDIHLTPRQLEVLSLAVALGYYETPHGINLRELASHVGISVGAVSELLRRGESIIIKQYVDRLAASRWDDATG